MSNTPPKDGSPAGSAEEPKKPPAPGEAKTAKHSSKRARSSAKAKRRWPRRVLIAVNAFVFLCLVAVGTAYGWARYKLDHIATLPAPNLTRSGSNLDDNGDGGGAGEGQVLNILLIGNETRQGLTLAEQQQLGNSVTYSGSEADIMMVLHLDTGNHTASILSIPRDLFTPMPAGFTSDYQKLDGALNDGKLGPDNLLTAVQEDFGIPVNGFIELNFNGFINSVNALGGINVYFPERVYDAESLLYVTEPGCHHLNGRTALSLVRARHLQYDPPGDDEPYYDWPQEAQSDLARIVRTHTFLKLVAAKARTEYSNPVRLLDFVSAVLGQMTLSPGLGNTLPSLVKDYLHLNLDDVPELTLPTAGVNGDYYYNGWEIGDVVFPVQPLDNNTIKRWDSDALEAPVKPKAVQLVDIAGDYDAALAAAQDLTGDGLKVSGPTEDGVPASTSETLVMYHHGSLAQALYVMKYLSGAVMLEQSSTVPAGQVEVDLGTTVAVKGHPTPATTTTPASGPTTTGLVTTTTLPQTTTPVTTAAAAAAGAQKSTKVSAPSTTTTTVPTPGGVAPGSAQDVQEPWDPRACPPGSKVINGA